MAALVIDSGAGDTVLPPRGGWIMVKRRPPAELHQVPIFSIFYALPVRVFAWGSHSARFVWGSHLPAHDLWLLYRDRHTQSRLSDSERSRVEQIEKSSQEATGFGLNLEMRVQIAAPAGDLILEPYEWTPCSDVAPFIDAIGREVTLHEYGSAKPDRRLRDQMFYLRSRGISRFDATTLLFGEVRKPNVFWLELAPEITRVFDRDTRPAMDSRALPLSDRGAAA